MDSGWVVAGCSVVTMLLLLGAQWVRYEKKLTQAAGEAENALQEAAEAKEHAKNLGHELIEYKFKTAEDIESTARQVGETVAALRTKIHEFETWSRDEFVRKQSFETIMSRNEKLQEQRDERMDKRFDRIEKKLDDAIAGNKN